MGGGMRELRRKDGESSCATVVWVHEMGEKTHTLIDERPRVSYDVALQRFSSRSRSMSWHVQTNGTRLGSDEGVEGG